MRAFLARRRLMVGLGLAVVTALGVFLLLPDEPAQPVAYTNISRNFRACMFSTTANSSAAAPIWRAVQAATTRAPINAQQVAAPPVPPDQLTPYLNGLVELKCQVIVTVGADVRDTVSTVAKAHPDLRFINVDTPLGLPNVHDTSPREVTDLVVAMALAVSTRNAGTPGR